LTDVLISSSPKAFNLLQIPQDVANQTTRSLQRAPNETAARSNGRHKQLARFAWESSLYGQEEDDRRLHADRHFSQQTSHPLRISILSFIGIINIFFFFFFLPLYLSLKHKTFPFPVASKQTTREKDQIRSGLLTLPNANRRVCRRRQKNGLCGMKGDAADDISMS